MTVPVLTDLYATDLLRGLAESWENFPWHVALVDATFAFDPSAAQMIPASAIIFMAQLPDREVLNGWAVAAPVLVDAYDPSRATEGVFIGKIVGSEMNPRVKLDLLPRGFIPEVLPFWITWQQEGIFRP